jgi:hypothetical protein
VPGNVSAAGDWVELQHCHLYGPALVEMRVHLYQSDEHTDKRLQRGNLGAYGQHF